MEGAERGIPNQLVFIESANPVKIPLRRTWAIIIFEEDAKSICPPTEAKLQ